MPAAGQARGKYLPMQNTCIATKNDAKQGAHEGGRITVILTAGGTMIHHSFARRSVIGRIGNALSCGLLFSACMLGNATVATAAAGPDCSRPYTLALHDHGLLYSADTDTGIDKDFAEELIRRSGCKVGVSLMSRARIWQLIESGALDFSLSGIASPERRRFASFAWYFSNKYYLLVRKDA